jgi:hypothetical protein
MGDHLTLYSFFVIFWSLTRLWHFELRDPTNSSKTHQLGSTKNNASIKNLIQISQHHIQPVSSISFFFFFWGSKWLVVWPVAKRIVVLFSTVQPVVLDHAAWPIVCHPHPKRLVIYCPNQKTPCSAAGDCTAPIVISLFLQLKLKRKKKKKKK